jgi:hypothetical protein
MYSFAPRSSQAKRHRGTSKGKVLRSVLRERKALIGGKSFNKIPAFIHLLSD